MATSPDIIKQFTEIKRDEELLKNKQLGEVKQLKQRFTEFNNQLLKVPIDKLLFERGKLENNIVEYKEQIELLQQKIKETDKNICEFNSIIFSICKHDWYHHSGNSGQGSNKCTKCGKIAFYDYD